MNRTIEDIANEYVTQNNRGTPFPYALLVIEKDLEYAGENGDIIGIYSPKYAEMYYYTSNHPKELLDEALNIHEGDEETLFLIHEDFDNIYFLSDLLKFYRSYIDEGADLYTYNEVYKRRGEQMFLTESSAKEHMRTNGHNMNSPKTYGIRVFRNPDMELIIQDLMSKATIPMEQWNPEALRYYKDYVLKECKTNE